MSVQHKFAGTFYDTDHETLFRLFKDLVNENVQLKIRIFGEEIYYEDEQLELYVQSFDSKPNVPGKFNYIINGSFSGTQGISILEKWKTVFLSEGISCSFEYYEEDENGKELGESVEI